MSCLLLFYATYLGSSLAISLHAKTDVDSFQPPVVHHQGAWYDGRTLMEELGFVQNPRLFPQAYHDDGNIPVVISVAESTQFFRFNVIFKNLLEYTSQKKGSLSTTLD